MRRHRWAGRALRLLVVGFLVLPLLGYFAPVASAHTQIVSVDGGCATQSGEWTVTWTIASDPGYGPMTVVVTLDGVDISSSFDPQPIPDPGSRSVTVHYPLSDLSTHVLHTTATWSRDGFTRSLNRSIDLLCGAGRCVGVGVAWGVFVEW